MFSTVEQSLFAMFAWMTLVLGGLVVLALLALVLAWSVNIIASRMQVTWRFAVYLMKRDMINSMVMQLPNGEYRQFARRDLPVRIEEVVKERDTAYTERVRLLAILTCTYDAALVRDASARDPDWEFVLLVELPTGQASWHIKASDLFLLNHVKREPDSLNPGRWKWDGHTTEEKNSRMQELVHTR